MTRSHYHEETVHQLELCSSYSGSLGHQSDNQRPPHLTYRFQAHAVYAKPTHPPMLRKESVIPLSSTSSTSQEKVLGYPILSHGLCAPIRSLTLPPREEGESRTLGPASPAGSVSTPAGAGRARQRKSDRADESTAEATCFVSRGGQRYFLAYPALFESLTVVWLWGCGELFFRLHNYIPPVLHFEEVYRQ